MAGSIKWTLAVLLLACISTRLSSAQEDGESSWWPHGQKLPQDHTEAASGPAAASNGVGWAMDVCTVGRVTDLMTALSSLGPGDTNTVRGVKYEVELLTPDGCITKTCCCQNPARVMMTAAAHTAEAEEEILVSAAVIAASVQCWVDSSSAAGAADNSRSYFPLPEREALAAFTDKAAQVAALSAVTRRLLQLSGSTDSSTGTGTPSPAAALVGTNPSPILFQATGSSAPGQFLVPQTENGGEYGGNYGAPEVGGYYAPPAAPAYYYMDIPVPGAYYGPSQAAGYPAAATTYYYYVTPTAPGPHPYYAATEPSTQYYYYPTRSAGAPYYYGPSASPTARYYYFAPTTAPSTYGGYYSPALPSPYYPNAADAGYYYYYPNSAPSATYYGYAAPAPQYGYSYFVAPSTCPVCESCNAPNSGPVFAPASCYCSFNQQDVMWQLDDSTCRSSLEAKCTTGAINSGSSKLSCDTVSVYYSASSTAGIQASAAKLLGRFLYEDCPPAPACACTALSFDKKDDSRVMEKMACCQQLHVWAQKPFSGLSSFDVDRFCGSNSRADSIKAFIAHNTWHLNCGSNPAAHPDLYTTAPTKANLPVTTTTTITGTGGGGNPTDKPATATLQPQAGAAEGSALTGGASTRRKGKKLSGGAIAGIVVGAVLGAAIGMGGTYAAVRKLRQKPHAA